MRFDDDQRALRSSLDDWLEHLSADHLTHDRMGRFPAGKWEIVRRTGLLRLPFDARWGGLEKDLVTTMYVLEGLGYGCRDAGLNFSLATHIFSVGVPVHRFGSDDLKREYMPSICDGSMIGAHAITEPDAGSDAMSMTTTATADGDDFVLSGRKAFITNGPVADVFIVYARTQPGDGFRGITALLVERGAEGFTVGEPMAKMGLRSSPFCELFFDDCRVPRRNIVGRPGAGFFILEHVMAWEILCLFAIAAGAMQHRLDRCLEHARSRTQFGQPIGSFQSIADRLVDVKIGVETSRRWLYETAQRFVRRENVTVDLAVTKLLASEANVTSALAAIQLFGARGYLTDYGLEQELRDAIGGTIYSGTSEMQRRRIAAMLGL